MGKYYKNWDIIYKTGTAEFRKLCKLGMDTVPKLGAVDEALKEKGVSTEGYTPEDYKKAIEDLSAGSYYGIEFDVTIPSPICTRIGDMQLHKTLPVHSKMRGCLLRDDGTVAKYLNSADWTSEVRDGSQGQVMVEVPEHWMKFETDGNKRRVYVAEKEIATFIRVPKYYISAYEAARDRTNQQLCSVVNNTPQFRGGSNNAAWDDLDKSLLGKPVTAISRIDARVSARNKRNSTKWNGLPYEIYKDLVWLYYIEYANLNCQTAYTEERDTNGYRQGGLGPGVTNIDNTSWNNWNSYNPFIPCGYTDSIGNNTGVVEFKLPESYGSELTVQVPRWRGIENLFGHISKICDGIIVELQSEEAGGESKFYVFDSPENYADTVTEHAIRRDNIARKSGYVKEVTFGDKGDIVVKETGASSTTYFSDCIYNNNIPKEGTVIGTLFSGGQSARRDEAGLIYLYPFSPTSGAYGDAGFRLSYITEL